MPVEQPSTTLGPLGTALNQLRTDIELNRGDVSQLKLALSLIEDRLLVLENKAIVTPTPPAPAPAPVTVTPAPVQSPEIYLRTVVPQPNASWAIIDRDDTVIDLGGASYPNLVVEIAAGLKHVGVRNGTLRAVRGRRNADDTSHINGLLLADLNIHNGQGTAVLMHGDFFGMRNVTATAREYCLYHGGTTQTANALIFNCSFTSEGPESTARFTSVSHLLVDNCQLSNGHKHALRVHGTCNNITVRDTDLAGAGNGLCIGAMGPQVPASVENVTLEGVTIDVGGPDRLNLARNGSLRDLAIIKLALRNPPGWDLITDYIVDHPASWDVSGLQDLK